MLKFGLLCLLSSLIPLSWFSLISGVLMVSFIWLVSMNNYDLGVVDFTQIDFVSYMLGGLSLWITSLMLMMSYYIKYDNNYPKIFSLLSMLMLFFLLLSFSTSNLLVFYVSFESTLIPIFLMVMGWGYQPERVVASLSLLFYTLTASLPMFLGVMWIDYSQKNLDLNILSWMEFSYIFLFFILTIAFLVKLPIYLSHLWLPKAHVEAPVAGSMILAGVLLKLGGYGLIRVIPCIEYNLNFMAPWLISLAILGALVASLICIRQVDCKSLVAYSSIAHMGLVIVGLVVNTFLSVGGAIIIMVAHGLCSSGLFSLVGMTYERVGTRSLILLRSLISVSPIASLWWFLFSVSNMAAPPTPSLAGEVLIFVSSLSWFTLIAILVGVLSFFAGAYNLYLFSSTQHGNKLGTSAMVADYSVREHSVLFLHFFPFLYLLPVLTNMFFY